MKQANSLPRSQDVGYTLAKGFPYTPLNDAAKKLSMSPARLSRFLRVLKVPVHRVGYIILLDEEAIKRIRQALRRSEIKRGRKKEGASFA